MGGAIRSMSMCLILIAYRTRADWPLVVAANRDEYHRRPSRSMRFWETAPQVLAGRDLKGGGTWMGVTRTGRFGALTNVRNPAAHRPAAPSRGDLVRGFLEGRADARTHAESLSREGHRYNGFNLILGDGSGLYYLTDGRGIASARRCFRLGPGVYGLSNAGLDTPWPKVVRTKGAFQRILAEPAIHDGALFAILADRSRPPDTDLPDTGVGPALERFLAPPFIAGTDYGTRAASVLKIGADGRGTFEERTFPPGGGAPDGVSRVVFMTDG